MKYCYAVLAGLLAISPAHALESTLRNPLGWTVANAVVRLKTPAPAGAFIVKEEGQPIPYQVENIDGQNWIWICSDFPAESTKTFVIEPGKPGQFKPRVKVAREGACYILDNGQAAIKVPAVADGPVAPGPIAGIKLDGQWVGTSAWRHAPKLTKFTATVIGDGTVLGKVRLRYEFELPAPKKTGYSEIDVSMGPGWQHAQIEEHHAMGRHDGYEIAISDGWKPNFGKSAPFSGGFQGNTPKRDRALLPGSQPYQPVELFIKLIPRWNQSCRDGWYFVATDGAQGITAMVTRASRWFWPHDNSIEVIVKSSGDYAGLRCPTWRGARLWFLMAGPAASVPGGGKSPVGYVNNYGLQSLDKLNHELILDWPGMDKGKFSGFFPYSESINPTGNMRPMGGAAIGAAGKPGDYSTLTQAQMMMHPDCYGSYYLGWSPENPNFYSDFMKVPIAMTSRLKAHPRFKELAALAESKLREDVDFSITLPGGAGQECPGYQGHGSGQWGRLAPLCRQHLGFDPMEWERVKVSASFLERITQPDGEIRRMLPIGDTHPARGAGPKPVEVAPDVVKTWKTEELPGFGVIFQNNPGTPRETYLSFKSGPNRGHYHGDQLAFHYCANAKAVAVDHHCSYHPRAGQEHMHNRVAFSTDDMPWANMDGYERLIAFKTSPVADVAIGQVESERLREVLKLPPEAWNAEYPQIQLNGDLTYRRTVVLVKGGDQDYFVLRDQFNGGDDLKATYCLHVRSDDVTQNGPTIDFGNLTLYCAQPAKFEFERLDWSHENGGLEKTAGARLTIRGRQGEFITVLYPGKAPAIKSDGKSVTIGADTIAFGEDTVTVTRGGKEALKLTAADIDLNRSQGNIGLFVPDAGYPFGPIPEWLIDQRASDPMPVARQKAWPLKP